MHVLGLPRPQRYDISNDAVVLDTFDTEEVPVAKTYLSCLGDKPTSFGYAFLQFWTFNSATNDCESFVYGGGNTQLSTNIFDTKLECEQLCKSYN